MLAPTVSQTGPLSWPERAALSYVLANERQASVCKFTKVPVARLRSLKSTLGLGRKAPGAGRPRRFTKQEANSLRQKYLLPAVNDLPPLVKFSASAPVAKAAPALAPKDSSTKDLLQPHPARSSGQESFLVEELLRQNAKLIDLLQSALKSGR